MATELNGRARVNIPGLTLIITSLTILGTLAMYAITAPIRAESEGLRTAIITEKENRREAIEREREIADLKIKLIAEVQNARLVEIETQFRAADQARNVQFATQQRFDAILYEKVFGSRYPSDAIFYPNISK